MVFFIQYGKEMSLMKEIKVGIIGFGTVGAGTADCLLKHADLIYKRTGATVRLAKVADLDITTDRGVAMPEGVLTTDANELIRECDIVVELVGGTTIAKTFIETALRQGKVVVTANKALLAKYGRELFQIADENNTSIHYEASVGGGIPIIKSLREGFAGNRINRMYGILNGTCNYIFTRMEQENLGFEEVLADAQRLGYAEANPSLDIDGHDTAHKAAILASLAYGKWLGTDPVFVEGIREVSLDESRWADEFGCKIKLLAIMKQNADDKVEVRVHPTLVPKSSPIASISGVFNGVMVNGDFVGDTLFYGRGAGREATASAVCGDIVDAALDILCGQPRRLLPFREGASFSGLVPMEDVITKCYIRIPVEDKPGVLAKVAALLSTHNISVEKLMQSSPDADGNVSIVILTHDAKEGDIQAALKELAALPENTAKLRMIRMEDF